MITKENTDRIHKLQRELFRCIRDELESDGHCKSYEGTFHMSLEWPSYFDYCDHETGLSSIETVTPRFVVTLHCYIVGPSRHYAWLGRTAEEALEKCEREVLSWIASSDAWRDFEANYEVIGAKPTSFPPPEMPPSQKEE